MSGSNASVVPQRAPKVAKSLELLRGQDEFRLGPVDEADVLMKPWEVSFDAPAESPYHPQVMHVLLTFPSRYPFEPPSVKFLTRVYHPNIDGVGTICLDLLKPLPSGSWKPSIDVITLMTAVKLLLSEPNPDDPLMPDIAAQFREDIEGYMAKANQVARTGVLLEEVPKTGGNPLESTSGGKKSLLKRKPGDEKSEVSENSKPLIAAPKASAQPPIHNSIEEKVAAVVSLISDDEDEFEPVRPVKRQLMSSKKSQ